MKKNHLLFAAVLMGSSMLLNPAFASNTDKPAQTSLISEKPVATVQMTFHSADLGIGYTWGDGILHYKGHVYKFKIKGGDVVAVGFSKSQATGKVYQLKKLYDFAGKYAAASGEATAGVGIGTGNLKNAKNVIIKLDASTVGGRLAGAPGGVEIKFKDKRLQKASEASKDREKEINRQKDTTLTKATKNTHMTADELNGKQLSKIKK